MTNDLRPRPRFPLSFINGFLALFCAAVALATVWVLPIPLATQICVTAVFVLVPLGVVIFWFGQMSQHRENNQDPPATV